MKKAYLTAFFILIAWSTFSFLTMFSLISSQEEYATLINLSGKQRMLSQKIAFDSYLVFDNRKDKKEELKQLLQEMKDDYSFISNHLPSTYLHDYYFASKGLDQEVKNYFDLIDNFLVEPTQSNLILLTQKSEKILSKLDEAVEIFEQESATIVYNLQRREFLIFIGTLFTLVLEAFIIIKPMIISNEEYLKRLKKEIEEQTKEIQIFAKVFENSHDGMMITNEQGLIVKVNNAFTTITGYDKDEVIGKSSKLLKSNKHDASFYKEMWDRITSKGIWSGEIINQRKNGKEIFENLIITKIIHKDETYFIGVFSDISEKVSYIKEVDYLANHDKLTGLLNRNAIFERIDNTIAYSEDNSMVLLIIDLDNFKVINDFMGHSMGDILLKEFSKRFLESLEQSDSLGRIGGDEFMVMIENTNNIGHENIIIEKLIHRLEEPVYIGSQTLHLSASIGVVRYPNSYKDTDNSAYDLVSKADLAMHRAKELGKNQVIYYDDTLADNVSTKLKVEQNLKEAISNNELELYLQPKVDLATGKIMGAELLVRWVHNGELIMPDDFIPIAEETNLILSIDQWVARESIRILEQLHEAGYDQLTLAFNLSGRSFSDEKAMDQILNLLYESRKAEYFEIEVTEGVFISSMHLATKLIKKIQSLGISVSLDDFGTGYSSFSYLSQIPFDTIKIDRSFVSKIDLMKQRVLTEAIISFSNVLNMKIIAEGIENEEQLTWLQEQHCQYGQGYLFSKPIPFNKFKQLL